MKINVEIDCSPQELRRFLGLADLEPMQASLLKQIQGQIASALPKMSAEQLLKSFVSLGQQGYEEFQRFVREGGGTGRGRRRESQ